MIKNIVRMISGMLAGAIVYLGIILVTAGVFLRMVGIHPTFNTMNSLLLVGFVFIVVSRLAQRCADAVQGLVRQDSNDTDTGDNT